MNCRDFERLLPELSGSDGAALGSALRTEALRHGATCVHCARLLAVARGEFNSLTAGESEAVLQAVLRQTTGATCTAAESVLPAWVDGLLSAADAELLSGHVAHCPACRSLVEVLEMLRAELPKLAEVDPGPDFTASVLARTSRSADTLAPAVGTGRAGGGQLRRAGAVWVDEIRGMASGFHRRGTALLRRPRAALELAYGATVIICLVAGSPATRVQEVSSEVTALASRVPSPRLVAASIVPEDGWDGAVGNLRGMVDKVEQQAPRGTVARLIRTWKRIASTVAAVRDHGPVIGRAFLRLDLVTVWREAETIRQAGAEGSEPPAPSVRPVYDRGMAAPGGAGDDPATSKGGNP